MKKIDRTIFKVFLGIMVPVLIMMYATFAPKVFSAISRIWNNETMAFASNPFLGYILIFVIIIGSLSLPVAIFILAKVVLFDKKDETETHTINIYKQGSAKKRGDTDPVLIIRNEDDSFHEIKTPYRTSSERSKTDTIIIDVAKEDLDNEY
jgi:hypothetical protein